MSVKNYFLLWEKKKLELFQNKLLRNMFGKGKEEVRKGFRLWHDVTFMKYTGTVRIVKKLRDFHLRLPSYWEGADEFI